MAAHRPPAFRGRASERELLDAAPGERARRPERGAGHPRRGGRRQDGAAALRRPGRRPASGSRRSPASSPRWSCRSRGCISSARRCSARLDALPEPQRRALRVALGLSLRRRRPTASSSRWRRSACWPRSPSEQPLLCLVDDAQWLDGASGQVLGFVARRLLAESVAIVFAVREPSDERELAGLPELRLGGPRRGGRPLPARDGHPRPARRARARPHRRRDARQSAGAAGAPARALGRRSWPAASGCPRTVPLSGRIEESFLRRLEDLPRRDAAAAPASRRPSPLGDPALMWRAAARLGVTGTALEPAASAGLLDVGAHVRFRHPLVRSAVYRSAPEPERRSVHRALAEATRSRARAAIAARGIARRPRRGPDEDVAAELERSAGRAQARGGLAAAAAFLGRAADLTTDPARRAERMLAAARGQPPGRRVRRGARRCWPTAQAGPLDELERARVDLLHAEIAFAQNRGSDAPVLLLRAARTLEPLDVRLVARDLPRRLERRAVRRAPGEHRRAADVSRRRERRPGASRAPASVRPAARRLRAGVHRRAPRGRARPAARGHRVRRRPRSPSRRCCAGAGWRRRPRSSCGTTRPVSRSPTRGVQLARDSGALEVLAVSANVLGQASALGGDFDAAAR